MARLPIRLRISLTDRVALGPGKADLLDQVALTGSISAAARAMGMSYRRAWLLIAELNTCFKAHVVDTAKGGSGGGGGAVLTPFGHQVLARYRAILKLTDRAIAADLRALAKDLR